MHGVYVHMLRGLLLRRLRVLVYLRWLCMHLLLWRISDL